jgi:Uncharacterized conserved protein
VKLAQARDPLLLAVLTGHEMQIRQVQDAQIRLRARKNGHLRSAQSESLGLPARICERTEAEGDGGGQQAPAGSHRSMMTRVTDATGGKMRSMAELKDRLQSDLSESIKSRDEVRSGTIRMLLAAVSTEEVAGKEARELSDDDVITVLGREAKKRREAAQAYDDAGRGELADKERAELAVIDTYLPAQLSEQEVQAIVDAAVAEVSAEGLEGGKAMGAVMKIVQPKVKGRADGAQVAASVKAALGM